MPVVPGNPAASYNPVPQDTAQSGLDTRPINIRTDPDMFGAGIGRALSQTGSTLEKVGDEWANTALQFARLDQDTKATQNATQYYKAAGDLDASFRSMTGGDPAQNLINHNNQLEALRQQYRDSLSPYAQREYDKQTTRMMGYDMRSAAFHAASETKKAAVIAGAENQAALIDQAVRNPEKLTDVIQGVKDAAAKQSEIEDGRIDPNADPNDEATKTTAAIRESKVRAAVGKAIYTAAYAKARIDPAAAEKMLNDYKDQMPAAVWEKAFADVRQRGVQVNAETEAARITSPYEISAGPGRVNFMRGQYGGPGQNITTVETKAGNISVNAVSAPAFQGFINDLVSAGAPIKDIGGFNDRNIAGTHMKSQHAFGNAIDIDQGGRDISPRLKAWSDQNPEVFRSILRKYNMISGGDFKNPDFGHFEWAGPAQNVQTKVTQATLLDLTQEAEISAQTKYPDDPALRAEYTQKLTQAILNRANVQQKVFNDQLRTYRNSMEDTLNQRLQNGRLPTSVTEANAVDPDFQNKYEYLTANSPEDKARFEKKFSANAKDEIPETPERTQFYNHYVGLPDEERAKVNPWDAFDKGLTTKKYAQQIAADQAKLGHDATRRDNADRILGEFRAETNDAQIFASHNPSYADANRKYSWLRGSIIQRLEQWEAQNKSAMPKAQRQEMMHDLLRQAQTIEPRKFLGLSIPFTGQTGFQFQNEYPPKPAIDALKANPALRPDFERKYGPDVTKGVLGE